MQVNEISGDARVALPLFQGNSGGSKPTSPLQLFFGICTLATAKKLNLLWHSKLPMFRQTITKVCYAASYDGVFYAIAIWSNPSSAEIDQRWMELKRMAIAPDAPKNTASRMISFMVKSISKKFPNVPKLISYQDPTVHTGTIYKASGWVCTGLRKSGGFSSAKCRYRPNDQSPGPKIRWEKDIK